MVYRRDRKIYGRFKVISELYGLISVFPPVLPKKKPDQAYEAGCEDPDKQGVVICCGCKQNPRFIRTW